LRNFCATIAVLEKQRVLHIVSRAVFLNRLAAARYRALE